MSNFDVISGSMNGVDTVRVLMVSAAVLPIWKCGVATVVDDIRNMLEKNGCSVALFALDIFGGCDRIEKLEETQYWYTQSTVDERCAYISDSLPRIAHVNERFKMCLETFRPDIVHFHTPQYFSLSLVKMAKEAGARTVITLHDWWWICPTQFFTPQKGCRCEQVSRENCLKCMENNKETPADYENRIAAMKKIEADVDCFTCVSSILYDDIVKEEPHLKKKVCIIPNAVPKQAERFTEMKKPLTFVFLGGRSEIKGYYEVIEAFEKISTAREWRLEIYGCTPPSQISIAKWRQYTKYIFHPIMLFKKIKYIVQPRRRLKTLVHILRRGQTVKNDCTAASGEREAAQRIFHCPPVSSQERDEILRRSHVVLMCSQVQESFSLVTYEAMANGCCVISTPCGGPSAVVKNDCNGILLQSSDKAAIEAAVRYLIENPDKVETYRHNAYRQACGFLGRQEIGEMYYRLLCCEAASM